MTTHSNTPEGQLSSFADAAMSSTEKNATKGGFLFLFNQSNDQTLAAPLQQEQERPQADSSLLSLGNMTKFMEDQIRCSIETAAGRSW